MKWDKGQSGEHVDDRRSSRRRRASSEPPKRRRRRTSSKPPTRRRKKSVPKSAAAAGIGLVVAAIAVIFGIKGGGENKSTGDESGEVESGATTAEAEAEVEEKTSSNDDSVVSDRELVDFLTFLVNDTNAFWKKTFEKGHKLKYKPAKLVIFDRQTSSGCGKRRARGGPVYCPNDQKMYVPPSFFAELRRKHDAPGDFAQALVIAHEMGHHAQLGLGITKVVHYKKKSEKRKSAALRWKRKQELQADCLAGVWAADIGKRGRLDPGDVEEALIAVAAIGDDALQKAAGRKVDRRKWGHGSSAQRVSHFKKGFRRGALTDCLRSLKSPYIK